MELPQIILLFFVGLGVGFVGTLIGAGGGFILVPVLLLLFPHLPPETITSISLATVFLNAGSGSIAYAKMKRIDYKIAMIFSVATLPGAILGAFMIEYIPKRTFDLLLGSLLMLIAIFLLVRPKHKSTTLRKTGAKGLVHRSLTDNKGHHYEYSVNIWMGITLSFIVGYLSSLLGIGGGIIHVPILTSLLNFPIHIATATSHLILTAMALAGTIVHISQGNLNGQWFTILYIGVGIIIGAQGGAYFSHYARPHWILRALAIALLLVGIRVVFM